MVWSMCEEKKGVLGLLMFASLAVGAGEYSARSYIADGLIVQYDAIENVAYGVHDSAFAYWVNLRGSDVCGDLPLLPLKTYGWEDDALALTAGDTKSDTRLITPGTVDLGNSFTIEVSGRSGNDGMFRRWEVYPWANTFETWNNSTEGYLERINGTRFAALTTQLAGADLAFATTYSAGRHNAYVWKSDGTFYSATKTGTSYSFNGRLSFFTGASSGAKARSIRIYNRVLSEDELKANQVIDQMRFLGKTQATVTLPQGWSFAADGSLLNAASTVMAKPQEFPTTERSRGITAASFARVGEVVQCSAHIEEGSVGVTNALYVAWAESDLGGSVADWPRVERVRLVPPDVTDVTFDMPGAAAAFAQTVHVRLFLTETSRPYDYRVSAINAKNNQYLDSGYYANPRTYASINCQLNDLTVQQRPFGADEDDPANAFSFSCYINGGGSWAYSCTDGKGNWSSNNKAAFSEPVLLALDAFCSKHTLVSPTHGKVESKISSTRTKTATHTLCFFGDKRKNDVVGLLVRDGDFHSARIAEEGKLLRSWTPCMVGGRAALYDSVSNEVFYSASGTDFLESGTKVSLGVEPGEPVAGSHAVGQLPKDVYTADTGATPLVVDYPLVYTSGGHKYGASPLTLDSPENDFGGIFTVHEGTLKASFGAGLAATDRLVLDGGLWGGASTLTAPLGTTAGTVEIVAGSRAGFAAYGAPNTVDFGGVGAALVYPSAGFAMSALLLNDSYSTDPVTFNHAIAGDGSSPALEISVGGSQGVMAKNVTGVGVTKTGPGELLLKGTENRFVSFTAVDGETTVASPGARTELTFNGAVNLGEGARLACSNASVAANGAVKAVKSAGITLKDSQTVFAGAAAIGGEGAQTASLKVDGGTLDCRGTLTLGEVFNGWVSANGNFVVTNDAAVTLNRLAAAAGNAYQYSGSVTVTNLNSGDCALGTGQGLTHNYYLYGGTFEFMGTSGNFQTGRAKTNGVSNVYVEREGLLKTHCWSASFGRMRYNMGKLYVRNGGRVVADYTAGGERALTVWFSDEGSGYLEVASGGSMDIDGRLCCCPSNYTYPERTGEIRLLSGGTVTTRAVACDSTACQNTTLIYDGGRVVVREAPQSVFTKFFKTAQIGVAGGVIDTNGSDIRFEQSFAARPGQSWTAPATAAQIAACAAFTKTGAGTLTWLGTNTYACATCVSNGVLATACGGALPPAGILKLAGGAVNLMATGQTVADLFGTGAVSNGTLSVTGAVWPGGSTGGVLELAGVAADFDALHYAIDETGACGTLKSTTPVNLGGVEIAVDGISNKGNGRLLLVDAPSVTGMPTCDLPRTSRLYVSGGKLYLGSCTGTAITLR